MRRPEPMPSAQWSPSGVAGVPNFNPTDAEFLNCFSRRVGVIAICFVILVMTSIGLLNTIELLTLAVRGADIALLVIYLLIQLTDITLACLLLLGIRDNVVRMRINIWLVWSAAYNALMLLIFIVYLAVPSNMPAGATVLICIQMMMLLGFRLFSMWTGYKFREEIMAAPPPQVQVRPENMSTY